MRLAPSKAIDPIQIDEGDRHGPVPLRLKANVAISVCILGCGW